MQINLKNMQKDLMTPLANPAADICTYKPLPNVTYLPGASGGSTTTLEGSDDEPQQKLR